MTLQMQSKVIHVLRDGTRLDSVSGRVIPAAEFPELYELLEGVNAMNEIPDHPVIRRMERYGTDGRWSDLPEYREEQEEEDGE